MIINETFYAEIIPDIQKENTKEHVWVNRVCGVCVAWCSTWCGVVVCACLCVCVLSAGQDNQWYRCAAAVLGLPYIASVQELSLYFYSLCWFMDWFLLLWHVVVIRWLIVADAAFICFLPADLKISFKYFLWDFSHTIWEGRLQKFQVHHKAYLNPMELRPLCG